MLCIFQQWAQTVSNDTLKEIAGQGHQQTNIHGFLFKTWQVKKAQDTQNVNANQTKVVYICQIIRAHDWESNHFIRYQNFLKVKNHGVNHHHFEFFLKIAKTRFCPFAHLISCHVNIFSCIQYLGIYFAPLIVIDCKRRRNPLFFFKKLYGIFCKKVSGTGTPHITKQRRAKTL